MAVAMSGGVDSAVALLRAGRDAIGVTLRLWVDPEAPRYGARLLLTRRRSRGTANVPWPRSSARDARPSGGVPARGRRPVRPRVRARRHSESVHPLQRGVPLRRAAPLRTPRRRFTAGHRPLRAGEAASRATAARAGGRSRQGPVVHARRPRPGCTRARVVPARRPDEDGDARGGGAGRPGGGRHRPESQEACFLGGDDYRAFLERRGLRSSRRADRRHGGPRAGPARRALALHARPAARAGRRRRRAALRAEDRGAHEHRRRRTASRAGHQHAGRTRPPSCSRRARRRQAPLSLACRTRARHDDSARLQARSASSRLTPSRAGRRPSSTRTTWSSAPASSRRRPRNIRA